ncbi:MAG: hypothetical protein ACLP1D_26145 [Xanthobacteraceae bacterium]|jgi:hypothetical protein
MAKIDLDSLSIEELATLRDGAIEKLAQKVAARQAELELELERLAQYGRPAKKIPAPAAKPLKVEAARADKGAEKAAEPASKVAREAA